MAIFSFTACSHWDVVEVIFVNVFRTGPVIEPEKLPVHGSLVGLTVEPLLNR